MFGGCVARADLGESCELFDETSQIGHSTQAAPAYSQTNPRTMFGAFRFTNPLSGGLLWYVILNNPGGRECIAAAGLQKRERALRRRHDRAASHPPTARPDSRKDDGGKGRDITKSTRSRQIRRIILQNS